MGEMSIKLTATSYVVLGLVARAGSCTPYDLKREIYRTLEYFWTFPHSQLYAEPERLKQAGLLQESRERGGRRRRTFSITVAGREALAAWFKETTVEAPEIRDPGLLKLYFGELAAAEDVNALARQQEQLHRRLLAEYEAVCEAHRGDQTPGYRLAIVEMGLLFERASVAFWSAVASSQAAPAIASTASPIVAEATRAAVDNGGGDLDRPGEETEARAVPAAQLPEHLL